MNERELGQALGRIEEKLDGVAAQFARVEEDYGQRLNHHSRRLQSLERSRAAIAAVGAIALAGIGALTKKLFG